MFDGDPHEIRIIDTSVNKVACACSFVTADALLIVRIGICTEQLSQRILPHRPVRRPARCGTVAKTFAATVGGRNRS